jgi:electron transfer flavoprotein alpha subunit
MVLVYSENKKLALELIGLGKKLAPGLSGKVYAVTINAPDTLAKEYGEHGADIVHELTTNVPTFKAEEYANALKDLITEHKPDLILIGSDKNGKELAGRLSAILNAGCVVDATTVTAKDKTITAERVVYSGTGIAIEQFTSTPAIVTVPPHCAEPLPKDVSHQAQIMKKQVTLKEYPSKIQAVHEAATERVNVEDAEIIVSCGRGFKNKTDIQLVNDLAGALKGKTVGCSRPIAADLKWLSEDHWIGLSGHKVKPKLYVAVGISGQIQHIAGMRDSGIVVAINKDPDALIFKSADYGIVGDLYQVLPKLTSAVKEHTA